MDDPVNQTTTSSGSCSAMSVPPLEAETTKSDRNPSRAQLLSKMAMLAAVSSVFSSSIKTTQYSAISIPSFGCGRHDEKTPYFSDAGISCGGETRRGPSFWSSLPCCGSARQKKEQAERTRLHGRLVAVQRVVESEDVRLLISDGDEGLEDGHEPTQLTGGTGGAYLLYDRNRLPLGVFKPADEEFSSFQLGQGGRSSIEPGMSMYREVAAYLLDHRGFSGVPPTCLASCKATLFRDARKMGSLQAFVDSVCPAGDLGSSKYSVFDVQRIALLDMRLLNLDRHDGNILVRTDETGNFRLVPIDHGLCLPGRLEVADFEWCWLHWPQVKDAILPEVRAYIAGLDVDEDIAILARHGIVFTPSTERVLRITTFFLKRACLAGLTLSAVANAMVRTSEGSLSVLERAVLRAKWRAAVVASSVGVPFTSALSLTVEDEVNTLVGRLSIARKAST